MEGRDSVTSRPRLSAPVARRAVLRVASVSYLNAKPLIHHLDQDPRIDLQLAVPAKLLEGLASSQFDIALLPVIDYQRLPGARIVPSGGIGCDGPTLTVRIFSRKPIAKIDCLACDSESHTSTALARIILAESFNLNPEIIPLSENTSADAILLIGDKVVTHEPRDMKFQLDLGAAWKELTCKPFVFAAWTTRLGIDLGDLPHRLEKALQLGLADLPAIVARHAVPHGWPPDLATKYLATYLKFQIAPPQLDAIRHFHTLAAKHGIISDPKPLVLYGDATC